MKNNSLKFYCIIRLALFLTIGCILFTACEDDEESVRGTWRQRNDSPVSIDQLTKNFVLGSSIYFNASFALNEYNTTTDTWTDHGEFPDDLNPKWDKLFFTVGNKVYGIFAQGQGAPEPPELWTYVEENIWSKVHTFESGIYINQIKTYGDRVYIVFNVKNIAELSMENFSLLNRVDGPCTCQWSIFSILGVTNENVFVMDQTQIVTYTKDLELADSPHGEAGPGYMEDLVILGDQRHFISTDFEAGKIYPYDETANTISSMEVKGSPSDNGGIQKINVGNKIFVFGNFPSREIWEFNL